MSIGNMIHRFVPKTKKLRGHIDHPNNGIAGWLAWIGRAEPRAFILRIDGTEVHRGVASLHRGDLLKAGINDGSHGFQVAPPKALLDGATHEITLVDQATGKLIATKNLILGTKPQVMSGFTDFDEWLRRSVLQPEMKAPFNEPEKRVLATMEGIRRYLCHQAGQQEPQVLVSIIMPAFNRQDLIADAINSVLSQTYQNIELIIADDCSTDNTVKISRSFEDPRIKIISINQNSGAAFARNEALKVASGSIIAYLDTDNTMPVDAISTIAGAFAVNPEADAIYGAQLIYNGADTTPSMVRFGAFNKSLLINRNYIDLGAFAHKKYILDEIGFFDSSVRRNADWELIMRISDQYRIVSVPAIISEYRMALARNTLTANDLHKDDPRLVRDGGAARMFARAARRRELAKPVSVIIPNYEALDDLRECIAALEQHHTPDTIEVIVVDNKSSQSTREYLEFLQSEGRHTIILNEVNFGFTYAVNQGVQSAKAGNDIVLLNNDAIIEASALAEMQAVAAADPTIAIVVPQQVLPASAPTANRHVPYAKSQYPIDVNLSAVHDNIISVRPFHDGELVDLSFAPFFCAYLKRSALDIIGSLDAEFGRHYRSDRLYCNMVRNILNMRVVYTPKAIVHHRLQVATRDLQNNNEVDFKLMFQKNQWPKDMANSLGFRPASWDT